MKKTTFTILSIVILLLPLIVIWFVYLMIDVCIFDNPDFWYGYMAYFGTVSLAIVALWQSENANRANKRIMNQQLRQKIGYFTIPEVDGEQRKVNKFLGVKVGGIYDINGQLEKDKEKLLTIGLKNIGEDVVFLNKITADINGGNIKCLPPQIGMIFKGETFYIFIDNTEDYQSENLKINIALEMSNSASCNYKQKIHIEGKIDNPTKDSIYMIECFRTQIDFEEK